MSFGSFLMDGQMRALSEIQRHPHLDGQSHALWKSICARQLQSLLIIYAQSANKHQKNLTALARSKDTRNSRVRSTKSWGLSYLPEETADHLLPHKTCGHEYSKQFISWLRSLLFEISGWWMVCTGVASVSHCGSQLTSGRLGLPASITSFVVVLLICGWLRIWWFSFRCCHALVNKVLSFCLPKLPQFRVSVKQIP